MQDLLFGDYLVLVHECVALICWSFFLVSSKLWHHLIVGCPLRSLVTSVKIIKEQVDILHEARRDQRENLTIDVDVVWKVEKERNID